MNAICRVYQRQLSPAIDVDKFNLPSIWLADLFASICMLILKTNLLLNLLDGTITTNFVWRLIKGQIELSRHKSLPTAKLPGEAADLLWQVTAAYAQHITHTTWDPDTLNSRRHGSSTPHQCYRHHAKAFQIVSFDFPTDANDCICIMFGYLHFTNYSGFDAWTNNSKLNLAAFMK